MEFNPHTNKQVTESLSSQKTNIPFHPPQFFNGIEVTHVDEQKHLEVILDENTLMKLLKRVLFLSQH